MKFSVGNVPGHNLYRIMRNQWKVARKRRVTDTNVQQFLEKKNIEVVDGNTFVASVKPSFDFSSVVGLAPRPIPKDDSHPLYKVQPCYIFRDSSVLLEGLDQALALTNTIQLQSENIPVQIENLIDAVQIPNQDHHVERCLKTSCLYDAEQKKLPVRKDSERPAWNFPRDYGITESRKNRMLCSRLMHLCALASPEINAQRSVVHNVPLSVPLQLGDDVIQFELRNNMFISSDTPLPPIVSPSEVEGCSPPELIISHPLISLQKEHFYQLQDVFPLQEKNIRFNKVHTIIIHYNNSEVKNIFETPVTLSQTLSRSLITAYTTAVAQARYNYGPAVKDIPNPIVVQCVHTDGRTFHFSMLQLNSADLSSCKHNVFWSLSPLDLYEDCVYFQAVPTLRGYNPQVFKLLLAFYVNNSLPV